MHVGALWIFYRDIRLVGIKEANGRNRPIQIFKSLDRFLAKSFAKMSYLLGKHRDTFLSRFGDLQQGMAHSGMAKTVFLVFPCSSGPSPPCSLLQTSQTTDRILRPSSMRSLVTAASSERWDVSFLKCFPWHNGVVLLGTAVGHADY